MDDRREALQEKLDRLLMEAAHVEVELSRADGDVSGVSHFSRIESRAHELGRRFSQQVQQQQLRETSAITARAARCPTCQTLCQLTESQRWMTSIDGAFEAQELKGDCPKCRRAFFPAAGDAGL